MPHEPVIADSRVSAVFTDPAMVNSYTDLTPQRVPGYADLHRMALILLSEKAPEAARILVLGAGGGLELMAFARARPDWTLTGVDPSQPMLDLARQLLEPYGPRVQLVEGYADDAPRGPFDGATCLLTLHFLSRPERLSVLLALRQRLKPGAPLVIAHHSRPDGGLAEHWLARSAAFAAGDQSDPAQAAASAAGMAENLPLLSGVEEESLLRDAGFSDIALFYAGFSFRGWVAFVPES